MEKLCQGSRKAGGAGPTWDSEVALRAHPQVLSIHLVTAISPGGAQPGTHSQLLAQPTPTPSPSHSPRELHVDTEVVPRHGLDGPGGHQQVVLLAQEDLAVGDHGGHIPEA